MQEALGDVRELFAKYDEADGAYVQALEHGGPAARLLRKRGRVAERQGRYDDALALYDAGAAEADANEKVALQLGRAIVLYHQGNIDDAARTAEQAADAAMALDDREALANAYWIRAIAETERGGPAREFFELALPIFEEFGLLQMQVRVLNNMAMRAFYVSEWETAVEYYGRAEQLARRCGRGDRQRASPRSTTASCVSTRAAWRRRTSCSRARSAPSAPRSIRSARRSRSSISAISRAGARRASTDASGLFDTAVRAARRRSAPRAI